MKKFTVRSIAEFKEDYSLEDRKNLFQQKQQAYPDHILTFIEGLEGFK